MKEKKKALGKLIHIDDVSWDEWTHKEQFGSRVKALGAAAGCRQIGVNIEELPPQKQSCPFHYHLLEEEHILVLEGEATLRWGAETFVLKKDHYMCFPAGDARGHCLTNHSEKPFRFLIIGSREKAEVCVYPDSNKLMCRSTGEVYLKNPVDYWEGES
jgi:uncharacterized cupin superfamily protein